MAQSGDFSHLDGKAVQNLVLFRFLDDPRGLVRDAGLNLLRPTAQVD
jgi:hypothetical protein